MPDGKPLAPLMVLADAHTNRLLMVDVGVSLIIHGRAYFVSAVPRALVTADVCDDDTAHPAP